MNRSAREGKSVKRFERSSGPDIALYKTTFILSIILNNDCVGMTSNRSREIFDLVVMFCLSQIVLTLKNVEWRLLFSV